MTALKLEVGKTYIKRNNNRSLIKSRGGNYAYPFIDSLGLSYTQLGAYCGEPSHQDLISEYIEPAQPAARTPHKWAAEMHAFADGYEIEVTGAENKGWITTTYPRWSCEAYRFRIKPEPAPLKPNIVKLVEVTDDGLGLSTSRLKTLMDYGCKKALRIEFNPNDQTLVSASVVTL